MNVESKISQAFIPGELPEALERLAAVASGERMLSTADQSWLDLIGKSLTIKSLPIDCAQSGSLSFDLLDATSMIALKNDSEIATALSKLLASVKAMLAASTNKTFSFDHRGREILVHNEEIASRLRPSYESESFEQLLKFCLEKKVFALKINRENGLVKTAEVEENWDMSGRQWVTDTVRCGEIERNLDPPSWKQAIITLCLFYNQAEEISAIENSIADCDYYRSGGLLNGVAHIFIPDTLKRDQSWFNNKRLESHGLALKAICETVIAGREKRKDGFSDEEIQTYLPLLATTIANLASYLKAISTDKNGIIDFAAPSAGPWEEIPFPQGQTWDIEAIRSGLAALEGLLEEKTHPLTSSIVASKNGQWLRDTSLLKQLIEAARKKIINRLFAGELPEENPYRPLDCSLAFISTSTIKLHDDALQNCRLHFRLLAAVEAHLVRANGIIRYAPFDLKLPDGRVERVFDSYLADNYWLLPIIRAKINGSDKTDLKDYGSSDCSTEEEYLARVKTARPGREAEWCFVSVLAEGYARQVNQLLSLEKTVSDDLAQINGLVAEGIDKASYFINCSFARLTSPAQIKANGMPCPAYAIPEAYEMVTKLQSMSSDSDSFAALPGVNTPLAWGQASLASACGQFKLALAALTT